MKILLLTTHLNIGGVGVYTVNLARHLKKEGLDVTVASGGGELERVLSEDGVPHVALDIRTKVEFGVKVWKAVPALVKLIASGPFQLLHAQTRVAQVLGCLAGKITGVPLVSTCHGFFKHRRLSRRIFPCWGERVIAISKSVRGHLLEDFSVPPGRVTMIYNGIELERYVFLGPGKDHGLMREIGLSTGATVAGAVGRLSSVKGFKYLISAFKDVVSRRPGIQLLLVGEGPEEDALHRQVRELGLENKVFFTPGGGGMEKYLSLLDIFCLPSLHEGLGLSLMEAMAAARACIASNVGGLSELITSGVDGILVPPKDAEALSAAISRLAEDTRLRQELAKNARKKAAMSFSIEESVARTIEVYEQVLGSRL